MSRRLLACVALAILFALVGPRLIGPQNRAANAPFSYEPPEGFTPVREPLEAGAKAWVVEEGIHEVGSPTKKVSTTRVVATHSSKEMSVEESDLAKLAEEMPKVFEDCDWTHRRHELRVRADGARVGLIEGDCNKDVDLGHLGLPTQKLRSRKLQLMFPDDTGTSIVTASYSTDQAAKWEPLFEATINKAKGVAVRVPSPPTWTFAAWASAGAVLGFLATSIVGSRSLPSSPARKKNEEKSRAKKNDDEEREEEGDEEAG